MLDRWMDDEDTTMSFLLGKVYFLVTAFFIVFFGIQTYLLVIHALPHDVDWMQDATVFSFDGMGLLYFLAINFYRTQKGVSKFRHPNSLRACWIMFIVCMAGSLLCTVAYMSLDSNHFNWNLLPSWLSIAINILVSLIFGIHCIVGYYIGHQESEAKREHVRTTVLSQMPQHAWRLPGEEDVRTTQPIQTMQQLASSVQPSARSAKHPKNCYCTSCRPVDVRTSQEVL